MARFCGTLEKQSKYLRRWDTRFFDLNGASLVYYIREGDAAPKGTYELTKDWTSMTAASMRAAAPCAQAARQKRRRALRRFAHRAAAADASERATSAPPTAAIARSWVVSSPRLGESSGLASLPPHLSPPRCLSAGRG